MSRRTFFLKACAAGAGLLLALLALFSGPRPLPAEESQKPWVPYLRADAFNIADDAPAAQIAFGTVAGSRRYATPLQYIRLSYTPPKKTNPFRRRRHQRRTRDLRLFTNNGDLLRLQYPLWEGEAGQFNGLLSTYTVVSATYPSRVPLFWRAFNTVQPGGVEFSNATASLWTQVRDPKDGDWPTAKTTALLPTFNDGKTHTYLGADDENKNEDGAYRTSLVFDLFSQVPDTMRPKPEHTPYFLINDFQRALFILCTVEEDVDLEEAFLFYRLFGEGAGWKQVPFFIDDDPDNPFWFHLKAEIPAEDLREGLLEYWFTVRDQVDETLWGNAQKPWGTALLREAVKELSSGGGRLEFQDGNPRDGTVTLELPPGALKRPMRLKILRKTRSTIPRVPALRRGQPAAPPVESGPLWPVLDILSVEKANPLLDKPGLLTLVYEDVDEDGLVDGSDYKESEMRMYWWDGFDWRPRGGQLDPNLNQVRAPVLALGTYALFPASAMGPVTYRPKEKIITPAAQDGVNDIAVFDGAGPGTVIKIFDITGRLVRELRDTDVWDGRDGEGKMADSGVYVYQVAVEGQLVNGTITVAK